MAKHYNYYDDWKTDVLKCPKCGWKGTFQEGCVEHHSALIDCSCPKCDDLKSPMLAIVNYPTTEESRANWEKLSEEEKKTLEMVERLQAKFKERKLTASSTLPKIEEPSFVLHWDLHSSDSESETRIKHGEDTIFSEPAVYEGYDRFIEVAKILRNYYGAALIDLVPTASSQLYLYGDRMSSPGIVEEAKRKIFRSNKES